jgi:hypothetical protein
MGVENLAKESRRKAGKKIETLRITPI